LIDKRDRGDFAAMAASRPIGAVIRGNLGRLLGGLGLVENARSTVQKHERSFSCGQVPAFLEFHNHCGQRRVVDKQVEIPSNRPRTDLGTQLRCTAEVAGLGNETVVATVSANGTATGITCTTPSGSNQSRGKIRPSRSRAGYADDHQLGCDCAALEQELRNLNRIKRGALAEVVAGREEDEAVLDRLVLAHAPDEDLVDPDRVARARNVLEP
jgi:hypothetical protein